MVKMGDTRNAYSICVVTAM